MTDERARIGRYDVELPLGEGVVGRVFVARDPVLGRQVAIKVLRAEVALGGELRDRLVERIRQAARAVATLSHPGLATLLDMGEERLAGVATPYLVFEFLRGPTLRERLATGPIAPSEVATIARTIGAALAHAHAAGVIQGDVNAENVLFTGLADPAAKLTEPGFAWLVWSDPDLRGASPEWAEAAAPAHGAPEILASSMIPRATAAAPAIIATPFSDQFSFAATLYEALTGKRPFGAGGADERAERVAADAREALSVARPNLRSFPRLDAIFDRALARDPRKRFSSCDVFGNVLATELEGFESGRMSASSASSIVPRATRRWQNTAAGLAVLVILSLIVLGRQRPTSGEGASLTSVASAFSATLASPRASPATQPSTSSPAHWPRATPSSTPFAATLASADSGPPTAETGAPPAVEGGAASASSAAP